MTTNEQLEMPREDLLERAVAEYLAAVDQGGTVSVDDMVAKHPAIAVELRDFFATIGSIEQMAGPVSAESTQSHMNAAMDTCLGDSKAPPVRAIDPAVQTAEIDDSIMQDPKFDAEVDSEATRMVKEEASETTGNSNSLADVAPDGMFGRYRIEKELGQGAMGAVYLAHDTELGRNVALKIPKFSRDDVEVMERFIREARSAATLHHRNICPVFDVGEINGQRFITMAFIEGKPLSSYARSGKRIPEKQVALLIRRLAIALEKAHEKGVLHRDLKPANIMLDNEGEPVVMDFGLARRLDPTESERITQSGAILGSPAYMSPEQIEGMPDEINAQADVYSLGVVFYELLTGSLPFKGSIASVIGQIMSKQAAPPSKLRPGLDDALEAICLKMIAKKKGERYKSMKEVAEAIGHWLTPAPTPSTASPGPREVAQPTPPIVPALSPSTASPGPRKLARQTSPPNWWSKRPVQLGGLGLFALILAGIVMILQTGKGTIRIETSDPTIQIKVEGETVILSQTGEQEIRLTPGPHTITVLREGFTFGTTSLTLTKGEVITVKVDLLDQEAVQLTQKETGKTIAKLAPAPKSDNPSGHQDAGTGVHPTKPVAAVPDDGNFALRFNDGITLPNLDGVVVPTLKMPTGSMTIECWARRDVPGAHTFLMGFGGSVRIGTHNSNDYATIMGGAEVTSLPYAGFEQFNKAGELVHLVGVRDVENKELRLYVNGKLIGRVPTQPLGEVRDSFEICGANHSYISQEGTTYHIGTIDEARVSDVARYNADFTPQTRFETDKNTLALYHFDEGRGDTLIDSSGNNHHGKITGAKWVPSDLRSSKPIATPQPTVISGKLFMHDPAFPQWVKDVQAMPVDKQIEAVTQKLVELNPGFHGKVFAYDATSPPRIENGSVNEFCFEDDFVTDISPIRAFSALGAFRCTGGPNGGKLSDLSPLKGMKSLRLLWCSNTLVSDLSPLAGSNLNTLFCHNTQVSDLTPLQEIPLSGLDMSNTPVLDFSPLMKCRSLLLLKLLQTKITSATVAALQKALPNCRIEWEDSNQVP